MCQHYATQLFFQQSPVQIANSSVTKRWVSLWSLSAFKKLFFCCGPGVWDVTSGNT